MNFRNAPLVVGGPDVNGVHLTCLTCAAPGRSVEYLSVRNST